MSTSATPIHAEPHPPAGSENHRPAELAMRRRLLSLALASVVASKGQVQMPDEAVFEALTLPAMIASAADRGLDGRQRQDVDRYIASLGIDARHGGSRNAEVQALHDETCLSLRPSLICMRWPGKTS